MEIIEKNGEIQISGLEKLVHTKKILTKINNHRINGEELAQKLGKHSYHDEPCFKKPYCAFRLEKDDFIIISESSNYEPDPINFMIVFKGETMLHIAKDTNFKIEAVEKYMPGKWETEFKKMYKDQMLNKCA